MNVEFHRIRRCVAAGEKAETGVPTSDPSSDSRPVFLAWAFQRSLRVGDSSSTAGTVRNSKPRFIRLPWTMVGLWGRSTSLKSVPSPACRSTYSRGGSPRISSVDARATPFRRNRCRFTQRSASVAGRLLWVAVRTATYTAVFQLRSAASARARIRSTSSGGNSVARLATRALARRAASAARPTSPSALCARATPSQARASPATFPRDDATASWNVSRAPALSKRASRSAPSRNCRRVSALTDSIS